MAAACPVPVFRYALEFWESDPYDVYVFHEGALNGDQEGALGLLREATNGNPSGANMALHEVDLSGSPNPRHMAVWRTQEAESLPHVVVKFPSVRGIETPVWTGALEAEELHALLDSPARQEITRRLSGNHGEERESAVWVLLESGDAAKDREAARLLEQQLPALEQSLHLPDAQAAGMDPDDPLYVNTISFSTMRISKDDPKERGFVKMLLRSEPDLVERADEPMVFPIYGRGLITYALVGRGINEWTLQQAGEYLAGATTCEVKAGNPGMDILLASANWESVANSMLSPPAPAGTPSGLGSFSDRLSEAEQRLHQ